MSDYPVEKTEARNEMKHRLWITVKVIPLAIIFAIALLLWPLDAIYIWVWWILTGANKEPIFEKALDALEGTK